MRALKFSIFLFALVAMFGSVANAACNSRTGEGCDSYYADDEETGLQRHFREGKMTNSTTYNGPRNYYPGRVSHNSGDVVYKESSLSYSREERITRAANGGVAPLPQHQAQNANPRQQTKQGYVNPKDGSMFPGGRCDRGKCDKDGSMFGGGCKIPRKKCMRACKQKCTSPFKGSCERACKPCFQCKDQAPAQEEVIHKAVYLQNYIVKQKDEIFDAIHNCKDMAPIELRHVDFKIKRDRTHTGFSEKLGNYRFRIFGCRRFDKHAMLNQGRIIQKDLQFIRIFEDMVSDCIDIIKTPDDLCNPDNKEPLPEYVLTAEITDYFMNVCDKYDWDEAKKEDLRTGSSEMTVVWRLTNVTGTEVVWKGETIGYAEIDEGEYNGEIVLLERAFADASNTLRQLPGFQTQLSKRVSKEELAKQRQELIDIETITNPAKCQFQEEIQVVKECGIQRVCVDINTCTGETVTNVQDIIVVDTKVTEDGGSSSTASVSSKKSTETVTTTVIEKTEIDETSGISSSGSGGIDENIITIKTTTEIDETSGISSSGSGGIDENITTIKTTTEIDETSGISSSGSGGIDENITTTRTTTTEIDENSGIYSSGSGGLGENIYKDGRIINDIDEASGYSSSGSGDLDETVIFEVVDNVIDENSGVLSSGIGENSGSLSSGAFADELWIDLPVENGVSISGLGGEYGASDGSDELCIVDRAPYETLSAENVFKIRSSVVNVTNAKGRTGSGLIISNRFILTSADLIVKNENRYDIETITGTKLKASAFRINPEKNTALLILDEKTRYNPLPLNLYLPQTGRGGYLTLGLINKETIKGKLEDNAKIVGYRYTGNIGSEIIVSSEVQQTTIGGALIDNHGTISGISHKSRGTDEGNDLFLPITSALKSVGLSICGKEFPEQTVTPWYERSTTPISKAIDSYKAPKAPKAMSDDEKK